MKISKARSKDSKEIARLNRLFHLDIEGFRWDSRRWVESEINAGNYHVIRSDNRVLAAICLNLQHEDGYIETIAVKKDKQSTGLGKKLIEFAKQESKNSGKSRLRVESFCEYGIDGFYEKCGFSKYSVKGNYAGHDFNIFLMNV